MTTPDKPLTSLTKIFHTVKKLIFIVSIAVTCIFLIHYLYSAVSNVNHTAFFVVYSLFFAIALITCILDVTSFVKNKKKPKGVYKLLRIIKYGVRFAVLIINSYELIHVHFSVITLIMIIVSGTSLSFQFSLEIIGIIIGAIIGRIKKSFEKRADRKRNLDRKNKTANDDCVIPDEKTA